MKLLNRLFKSKKQKDNSKDKIHYLCDRRACIHCHKECKHTTEVEHAGDFEIIPGGTYRQIVSNKDMLTIKEGSKFIIQVKEPTTQARSQSIASALGEHVVILSPNEEIIFIVPPTNHDEIF